MAIRWTFKKRSPKTREDFLSDPQLKMTIDYAVTIDFQKKSFIETAD